MGAACLWSGCVRPWDWPPLTLQGVLDRAWGSRFSRMAAISRAVATRLSQYGAPHLQAAEVIYPGTAVVRPRTELGPVPTVIAAGRLVPEKGLDVLVQAFAMVAARHREARLVVVGDGTELQPLQRLAVDSGIGDRVEFCGRLPHPESVKLVRSAWVSCVPSLWEEPFGMIAAESQVHGVAVIASRTGGLAEIVADEVTGYLVPPGDPAAIAGRLDTLLGDRAAAQAIGHRGHERARELFGLDRSAARFESLDRETIRCESDRA